MAVVTINGSITIEDNASGNADFPGVLPKKETNGTYIDTNVGSLIVTDVVLVADLVVDIASIA